MLRLLLAWPDGRRLLNICQALPRDGASKHLLISRPRTNAWVARKFYEADLAAQLSIRIFPVIPHCKKEALSIHTFFNGIISCLGLHNSGELFTRFKIDCFLRWPAFLGCPCFEKSRPRTGTKELIEYSNILGGIIFTYIAKGHFRIYPICAGRIRFQCQAYANAHYASRSFSPCSELSFLELENRTLPPTSPHCESQDTHGNPHSYPTVIIEGSYNIRLGIFHGLYSSKALSNCNIFAEPVKGEVTR